MIKKISPLPIHVAIIMDGNGRWAKKRNLPRKAGHKAGTQNILSLMETLGKYGIKCVTLYSFSTENWNRPQEEINAILDILGESLRKEVPKLHKNGVRVCHIDVLKDYRNRPEQQSPTLSN
jgi:undecaprenyl diphosphate synthase